MMLTDKVSMEQLAAANMTRSGAKPFGQVGIPVRHEDSWSLRWVEIVDMTDEDELAIDKYFEMKKNK